MKFNREKLNLLFFFGFFIKLFLIFTVTALPIANWYAPFMQESIKIFSFDIWDTWIASGGSPEAYPYGYTMWLTLFPVTILFSKLGFSIAKGYMLTLFFIDVIIYFLLKKIYTKQDTLIMFIYWLSPIVIIATYIYGLNDIIPVLFLLFSIYFLFVNHFFFSGLLLSIGISAKISVLLAAPFFCIWFLNNKKYKSFALKFFIGLIIGCVTFLLPQLLSEKGVQMLINNREMSKLYSLSFSLGSNITIFLLPLLFLNLVYLIWKMRRINFDLLLASFGIAFLVVPLFIVSSPGWYIWATPFLIFYATEGNNINTKVLIGLFFIFYTITFSFKFRDDVIHSSLHFFSKNFELPIDFLEKGQHSFLVTIFFGIGTIIITSFFVRSIKNNDFYRISRKPFLIGIAGDSGSGKDTLANAIEKIIGRHSVVKVSGDDYHLWNRHEPMWKLLTHLNPRANDLSSFTKDVFFLKNYKNIRSRHYDHQTGKMTLPFWVKSNDMIIATGLHALYLPELLGIYDLSIFLSIDDDLRKYFKLKRDVKERGHRMEKVLSSMEARVKDANTYIYPQRKNAELIFSLQPLRKIDLNFESNQIPKLKLVVSYSNLINHLALIRHLVGLCGLNVDRIKPEYGDETIFSIDGDITSSDISLVMEKICPRMFDIIDLKPKWEDGLLGLMQLITLVYINQKLEHRLIV